MENNKTIIPSKNGNNTAITKPSQSGLKSFSGLKAEQISTALSGYKLQLTQLFNSPERASRGIQIMSMLIRKNPELMQCSQASIIGAMLYGASLNLDFSPQLGHCYLVPYKNKNAGGASDAQFQLGYRGLVELVHRSERVSEIYAHCVYKHDDFTVEFGLSQTIKHVPDFSVARNDNDITFVYAVGTIKGGGKVFIILSRNEIEELRKRSPMQKFGISGAWKTDYAEMAKAKALKRLCKLLPLSIEYDYRAFSDGIVAKGTDIKEIEIEEADYEDLTDIEIDTDTENDLLKTLEQEKEQELNNIKETIF